MIDHNACVDIPVLVRIPAKLDIDSTLNRTRIPEQTG